MKVLPDIVVDLNFLGFHYFELYGMRFVRPATVSVKALCKPLERGLIVFANGTRERLSSGVSMVIFTRQQAQVWKSLTHSETEKTLP